MVIPYDNTIIKDTEELTMLNVRQTDLVLNIPKAENHIHIEGSIPWELALKLAKKNGVTLPADTVEGLREWTSKTIAADGLNGFMVCDRTINAVSLHAEDYEQTIVEMARNSKEQNVLYQEWHLDYPLNAERGISMDVVMEGYRRGKERAWTEYGVDIVYIAGIDRSLDPQKGYEFIDRLQEYGDLVEAIGMDCEEKNNPCRDHVATYQLAKERGLYLTAHAGEDGAEGIQNMWDAIHILKVDRVDHGCQAAKEPELMAYMAEHNIMCAMCPCSNLHTGAAKSVEEHPLLDLVRNGVPVSISSDDPPYMMDLVQEYALCLEELKLTEDELIACARNGFVYSVRGQKYLPVFDKWVADFRAKYARD